jgi:hypothetical protein
MKANNPEKGTSIVVAVFGTARLFLDGQANMHEGACRMKLIPLNDQNLKSDTFRGLLIDLSGWRKWRIGNKDAG